MVTSEQRREWGAKGGLTTAAKYGPSHMAEIGSKGFTAYANKYHNGNRAVARRILRLSGKTHDYDAIPYEWTMWLEDTSHREARKNAGKQEPINYEQLALSIG